MLNLTEKHHHLQSCFLPLVNDKVRSVIICWQITITGLKLYT